MVHKKHPKQPSSAPQKLICGVTQREYRVLLAGIKDGRFTREELEEAGIIQPTQRGKSNAYLAKVLEKLGK
jgi:hypothetical protein